MSNANKTDDEVQKQDQKAKSRMKQYFDKRYASKTRKFNIGDTVLLRQQRNNKTDTTFKPVPFVVTDVKGTTITAESPTGNSITRNCSFFKIIRSPNAASHFREEEENGIPHPVIESSPHTQATHHNQRRFTRTLKRPAYLNDYVSALYPT